MRASRVLASSGPSSQAMQMLADAKARSVDEAAKCNAEQLAKKRAAREARAAAWRAEEALRASAAIEQAAREEEQARSRRDEAEERRQQDKEREDAERAAFVERMRDAAAERDEASQERRRVLRERAARRQQAAASVGDGDSDGDGDGDDEPKDRRNHYEILGVSHSASDREIRKAYLRQAAVLHPDKGGSRAQFERLREAHRVLSVPYERAIYNDALELASLRRAGRATDDASTAEQTTTTTTAMPAEGWSDGQGAASTARTASSRAREAFVAGEFRRAASLYTDALRHARAAAALEGAGTSGLVPLLLNRSLARLKGGDAAGALDDAESAARHGGGRTARARAAECLRALGRDEEAQEWL
ncbi:DnaJ protein [Pseudoscourfieldia marina]